MSDLIRKSDVLGLLYKIFDEYNVSTDKTTKLRTFGSDVFKAVRGIPTAYSVDKVVEDVRCRCYEMELDESQTEIIVNEIVKRGGVADDVCEWKKSEEYPFDWIVGCDGCEVNHRQGDYCPRCGKKIKVVE